MLSILKRFVWPLTELEGEEEREEVAKLGYRSGFFDLFDDQPLGGSPSWGYRSC